jgi:fatty-acyl-CoA synthase
MLSTVWKEFKERFCVTNIVEYYASTEGTVLFFNKWKFGAVGFIGPISRLLYPFKIVRFDDDGELVMNNGRPVQCGYGEVGEVLGLIDPSDPLQQMNNYIDEGLIKGRILTSVYREGDTWYRTGDLLRRESDGFIYFVGRLKHTVRLDGSYISYQHVEDKILSSQPNGFQIEDCYLTSVKSGDGEKPRLLCYLRIAGGFNERELYKYFAGVLTPHEVPRYIILRQEPFRYTDSHRLLRDIPAVDSATIERLIADSGCLAVDEPLNRHGA